MSARNSHPSSLPMGSSSGTDTFQEKMSEMFQDLENEKAHNNDLLVLGAGTHKELVEPVSKVLNRLKKTGSYTNAKKLHFCKAKMECLDY